MGPRGVRARARPRPALTAAAPRDPPAVVTAWISKREAISLVAAASGPDVISRASVRATLGEWVSAGRVRTKAGEWPSWAKRPRQLYRRADIDRAIADRQRRQRPWTAAEDALLGTDYDRVIARRLRRTIGAVAYRREKLRIAPHGPSLGRCNPGSWRRQLDDPRLLPPVSSHG